MKEGVCDWGGEGGAGGRFPSKSTLQRVHLPGTLEDLLLLDKPVSEKHICNHKSEYIN